jgi:hypothetical protein
MLKSVRLTVDTRSFERLTSGSVFGSVHFEIGSDFFPAKGWTDFVQHFARGWLEALLEIASGSTERAQVWFMDGPYTVDISVTQPRIAEILFLRGTRDGNVVVRSAEAELRELLQNAIAVAEEVLSECRKREWTTNDTEPLTDATRLGLETLARIEQAD